MKTKNQIHPEWLSLTITRFYSYVMAGWNVTVYEDGSWEAVRRDKHED